MGNLAEHLFLWAVILMDASEILSHLCSDAGGETWFCAPREREGNQGTKCLLCGPTLKDPSGL